MSEKLTPEQELDEILNSALIERCASRSRLEKQLLTWRNKRDEGVEERVEQAIERNIGILRYSHLDRMIRNVLQALRGPEICEKCHQEIKPCKN